MKRFLLSQACAAAVLSSLLMFAGCDKKGTTGGPGVTTTSGNVAATGTAVANSKETFNLTAPSGSTTIKQGDAKTIDIGISRGGDFNQAVAIKFSGMPAGVTVDPAAPEIKAGDKDVKVAIAAAADAAPGEYVLKATGTPTTGEPSTADVKITVEKK